MSMRCLLLGALLSLSAASAAQEPEADAAAAFVQSLQFRSGEVEVPAAHARFRLNEEFRFLAQDDARRVLEQYWGNPPDDSVLGLIVPRTPSLVEDDAWAVVVTYVDDGYISDEDASEIDYVQILQDDQEATRDSNEARVQAGYEPIELVGWAEPPHYDSGSKKIYWAKELAFEGSPEHTLNYDIRALGRYGYLSLNAVANMGDLGKVRGGMQSLLPMVDFDAGHRYADYDASTDKAAAYGLAALVGGGLAAKTGLFGKLLALLLAAKKLVLPALLVAGAFVMRLFKGKPKD